MFEVKTILVSNTREFNDKQIKSNETRWSRHGL